jgi:ATP-dependent Lhr-like helicase
VRLEVEDRLKRGELRAVVCSTSLELGIDIGSIELVVMMSTPKGCEQSTAASRASGSQYPHGLAGRSHGDKRERSRGELRDGVARAEATPRPGARAGSSAGRARAAPRQHGLHAMVATGDALELIRRAYPFRNLTDAELEDVLDYLAGGGASLRRQYSEVFGKIEFDGDAFRTRPGRVQRDFLQNVGVIPNVGQVRVRTKRGALGSLEESFIRQLNVGDIFIIAGNPCGSTRSPRWRPG